MARINFKGSGADILKAFHSKFPNMEMVKLVADGGFPPLSAQINYCRHKEEDWHIYGFADCPIPGSGFTLIISGCPFMGVFNPVTGKGWLEFE